LIKRLEQNPKTVFNNEQWGLRDINFEEHIFDEEGRKFLESKPVPISFKQLSAIKPDFYFERILIEEQKITSEANRVVKILRQHCIIWFFIRIAYRLFIKLYRMMREIKRKLFSAKCKKENHDV